MALKVSSWVKSTNDELVPVCQPNHVLTLTIQFEEYVKLILSDDLCLDPCWEYLRRGYECFILESQFDSTIESFFKFSYRELKAIGEEKAFTLKRNETSKCVFFRDEIIYVSDITGFSMLKITESEILVYYYDFEKKFTSNIKIPSCDLSVVDREVKLIDRSIWIVREVNLDFERYGDYVYYVIDLINIKDEKEWHFVTSHSEDPINLGKVLSKIIFIGNNRRGNSGNDVFCSCKILYIDHEKLKPHKINSEKFVESDKPKELRNKNVVVLAIYKTIVILSNKMNFNVSYFLNYNEKLQLRACKMLELTTYINVEVATYARFADIFIPKIDKMFLFTSANSVVVIDMRALQVTQILEGILHPYRRIKWSEYEKLVDFLCGGPDGFFLSKYVVSC